MTNDQVTAQKMPPHIDASEVRHCELFDRKIVYQNPYETIITDIHRGPPVFYADNVMFEQPGWVVRRYSDLKAIYADKDHFTVTGNSFFAEALGEDWLSIPAELDPPRHTAFRAAVNPQFSPSRIVALEGQVRARARALIERFRERGSCEFVSEFAVPFPVSIFLDLVGLPQERLEEFVQWERGLLNSTDADIRLASLKSIRGFLVETIESRKRNPGTDLISQALASGIDGRKWSDDEIFGYFFNLYLGGLDTVTSNLSLHFYHLATRLGDQRQMRRNDVRENVVAIEELLRAYAAASTTRICTASYEVGGKTIMPGDVVIMATALPGRDPEAYEAPNEIRLDRRPTHLTLGHSYHRCLGQHLARRELQTAIQEFLQAVPEFRVEQGFEVPFFLGNVLNVPQLQLTWQ